MAEQLESKFPEDWRKEFLGKSGDDVSTSLSRQRTGMSTHRTELSEHRTDLSTARSHMANERTHLAYLRTSLSLMSFGITLNRFSIYLRENEVEKSVHRTLYETENVGLGMVLIGLIILAWSLQQYKKVSIEIENCNYHSQEKSIKWLTLAIIFLGGLTAFWMIVNQLPGD